MPNGKGDQAMNSCAMRIVSHLTCLLFIALTAFVSDAFAQIYHVRDVERKKSA
jgi:hypothetical protein